MLTHRYTPRTNVQATELIDDSATAGSQEAIISFLAAARAFQNARSDKGSRRRRVGRDVAAYLIKNGPHRRDGLAIKLVHKRLPSQINPKAAPRTTLPDDKRRAVPDQLGVARRNGPKDLNELYGENPPLRRKLR